MLMFVAGAGNVSGISPSSPYFEVPSPFGGVLINEVTAPEKEAFIKKALSNESVIKLLNFLSARGYSFKADKASVKRAEFKGQSSTFALLPCVSPKGETFTVVYWSAGGKEGALAVNREGGYQVEKGQVKPFSAQELLKNASSIAPERQCPDCWNVIFAWCTGSCWATYCYGYCCYDACENEGYCVITGPCW